jgi:outer membrane protein assembly factor BamB
MRHVFILLLGVCTFGQGLAAQEWGQWRGPSRDGVVAAANVPRTWPASVKNAWRVEVGEGYSSPVVSGGRAFVHGRRDPEEIITAVDLASGKVVWQQKYAAPFNKNQYAVSRAKGPHSTPLVTGGRLFTLGVTGVLSAWNTASGALLWRKDYSASVDTSKLFCGTAMSPLLEGGALIVQVGSDIHGGRVMALEPATGAERWTWKGLGPGYASPIVITAGGVRQIVALTNGSIEGIDAKSGAPLWSVPFPDEWHENIVTPLWTGTHLAVSGARQGTHAYTLRQNSGKWHATEVWKNGDVAMYMSSPVFADGTIYGLSQKKKGQFVALDAATGTVRWATEGREGEHASVLLTPGHVVFLTNGADLVVARRSSAKFDPERRYIDVTDSETWAAPVLLSDGIIVRDAARLARLAWAAN